MHQLDYYVRQFATTGMSGPLNWYRTMDMNWALTPQLAGAKVWLGVVKAALGLVLLQCRTLIDALISFHPSLAS